MKYWVVYVDILIRNNWKHALMTIGISVVAFHRCGTESSIYWKSVVSGFWLLLRIA